MSDTSALQILLVEDDPQQRDLVESILRAQHWAVTACDSVEAAIVALKAQDFDVVFCDWKLGGLSGLALLRYVREHFGVLGFAIATAYGTINHAVEAMQAGADDYLAKPFQKQELLLCIEKIANAKHLRAQNRKLSAALSEQQQLVDLVGSSKSMQQVYQRINRVSNTGVTVLITGESGTGKELAARALHQLSERHAQPFIALNCGAIPETLAEAELFGSRKGAFTGATADKPGKLQTAHGGTLFLDEIGELPLALQAKLLRFLQEGTVTPLGSEQELALDVRIIAATHRNLLDMVQQSTFREDLFYRLNIVPIHMPPLRERNEDIGKLIEFFLHKHATTYRLELPSVSTELMRALLGYHWPGNVREMANRLERFVLLQDEQECMAELHARPSLLHSEAFVLPKDGLDWDNFERDCLQQALQREQGNRTRAARLLGMNYKAFLYRLEKYKLV